MISPPISPLPSFSLSAPSNQLSTPSSSLLFPPSLYTWSAPPDSPTPFTLMAGSAATHALSSLPPLLSPLGLVSSPRDVAFNSSLLSFNLPAAMEPMDGSPSSGRSASQSFAPDKRQGRPSPMLASAITMAIAASSHPPAPRPPSPSPLLLSSFPPVATSSASQPTPAVAPSTSSTQQSVCHPTLTLLRSSFDRHTAITTAEQSRWQLLLSTSSLHHTRAQAEVGRLYEHFDAIVRRLSGVYERRMDEDADGASMGGGSMEAEKVRTEALKAVHTIADKFVTSRQAVLHLHLYQSSAAASKPPRTSSRSSSSSSSSSGNSASASPTDPSSPPSSSRPIRKARRVVNPPPPNSTSTKRSYFHKHSTAPLKQWLQANMSDPYPSSEVKSELSTISGLTYEQVQHWSVSTHHHTCISVLRRPSRHPSTR